MHLISSLCSGIRGAENGTVGIFVRGTSTRAVFYENFEADVHPNSGSDVTLDENGSAIIYVNQFVDVVVQSSDGTEVRNFVEAVASPNVEVISNSFTGTDLTSGATGANKPTNLQSVLDLWKDTNGAKDWKVLFGGVETSIQDAVAALAGIFINVKDPTYGAVGDGVADDTTPIQNALNAASSAGGGIVLFPAGTYRVTAKLTVAISVSLWGLGSATSVLKIDHATADLLEYGAGVSVSAQEIRGLGISVAQANTGKLVSLTVAGVRILQIHASQIADSGGLHTGDPVVQASGALLISDSIVNFKTSGGINSTNTVGLELRNCQLLQNGSAAYNGTLVTMSVGSIVACSFSFAATSGTHLGVNIIGNTGIASVRILGCSFAANGGTAGGIQGTSINLAAARIIEAGNSFDSDVIPYAGLGTQSNNPQTQLGSREMAVRSVTSDAAAVSLQGDLYGTVVVTRTAAGAAQSFTSTVGPPGSFLTVIVYNNSGGALAADPTFDSGFYAAGITITKPSNGKISIAHFRSVYAAGGGSWFPLAAFKVDF